jgi:hypothetical protein
MPEQTQPPTLSEPLQVTVKGGHLGTDPNSTATGEDLDVGRRASSTQAGAPT